MKSTLVNRTKPESKVLESDKIYNGKQDKTGLPVLESHGTYDNKQDKT